MERWKGDSGVPIDLANLGSPGGDALLLEKILDSGLSL